MTLTLHRPDGRPLQAVECLPSSPSTPTRPQAGLVLLHEWWGIDAPIQEIAQRLSDEGYHVLIPDLYRGQLATDREQAAALMASLDRIDAVTQDVRACALWLRERGLPVGVTGFCMGGALTVAAAVHVPDIQAAACFYGIPAPSVADPARIRIPLQGHFALRDDWCTPDMARALQATMIAQGQQPEIHFYPAGHAFFNHGRPHAYDADAAALAWQRLKGFLSTHLAVQTPSQ